MHGVDHPGGGHEVVGPVDGGLVADRHREHDVLVARGEHDAPFEVRLWAHARAGGVR